MARARPVFRMGRKRTGRRSITTYINRRGYLWLKVPADIAAWLGKPNPKRLPLVDMPYAEYVWRYRGGAVPNGWHIHHRDHDHQNNDISNLQAASRELHMRHHRLHEDAVANSSSLACDPNQAMTFLMWDDWDGWTLNPSEDDDVDELDSE